MKNCKVYPSMSIRSFNASTLCTKLCILAQHPDFHFFMANKDQGHNKYTYASQGV